MGTLVSTGNGVFPYVIPQLSNISPFTYRDGMTYLEVLYELRDYVVGLTPELTGAVDAAIGQFNDALAAEDGRVVASIAEFHTLHADFVATVNAAVASINNKTGALDIQRLTLTADTTVTVDPVWPTNHPIDFVVTQDGTGGRTLTFGPGIGGAVTVDPAPGAVTAFTLIPLGTGTWEARTDVPSYLAPAALDTRINDGITAARPSITTEINTAKADAVAAGAAAVAQEKADRNTAISTSAGGLQTQINGHHTRHEYGGGDQLTLDTRQVVDPVRDWVRAGLLLTPTTPFRIVFMGDSQTNDGAYEKPTGRADVWGGGKGYSYRLANLLTKGGVQSAQQGVPGVTTNTAPGAHVWSTAVAGTRSDTYAPSGTIANVGAIQPHLVFHMIGTNDFALQTDPAAYQANVEKALGDVWGLAPDARQVLIMCWPRIDPAGMTHPWTQYTAAMRAIAANHASDPRFTFIDYGARFERTGGAAATSWWSAFPDGIHGLPQLHRDLTEHLAGWFGLPSPLALFGPTRAMPGSVVKNGALDDNNPASNLDIHAVPVPRTITLHINALAIVGGEGDFHIQMIDDLSNKTVFPFHVQAGSLRNYDFTMQLEVPPNTSRYFYLSGTGNISITAGAGYDQYNQFWAEVTYI